MEIFTAAADASRATYTDLLARLEAKFADQPNAVLRRKQARQAARAVLPNATETRIVVTGNYRAWRHFIAMRASEHADVEIRRLAIESLRQLIDVAPQVFSDFDITTLAGAGPYGAGNPEPILALPNHTIAFADRVGENHIRVRLRAGDGAMVNAIAFRAIEKPLGRALVENRGNAVHAAGCIAIDRYQGEERVQFRLIDIAVA